MVGKKIRVFMLALVLSACASSTSDRVSELPLDEGPLQPADAYVTDLKDPPPISETFAKKKKKSPKVAKVKKKSKKKKSQTH